MSPACSASPPRQRRAVTLLELVLVLCLLVALAAMAWPAIQRPMASQRLRTGADAVRVALGRARLAAMSSGRTVVFQYAVQGDCYRIQYRSDGDFCSEPVSGQSEDYSDQQPDELAAWQSPRRLPEGVCFACGQIAEEGSAAEGQLDVALGQSPQTGWSQPIVFYPDGTTCDARLVLTNEHGRSIELSLRGLTGVVTVGQMYSGQEETQ